MTSARLTTAADRCRLMFEGAGAGARQMAVDEVLLESAAATGQATLRFYQWSQPTLSLGYFQACAERANHAASRECPVVRRQTGGGAILHDRELTYSLVLPWSHPLAHDPTRLYDAVHDALLGVLAAAGIAARRRRAGQTAESSGPAFLCFLREAESDVLLDRAKICGSAQRRRRGAVLQHGSLLLARSAYAPELPGILELSGRSVSPSDTASTWADEIVRVLQMSREIGQLSDAEQAKTQQLVDARYAQPSWTERR